MSRRRGDEARRVGRYRLPSSAESERDYAALTNADLSEMSAGELRRELARVHLALALGADRQLTAVRVDHPGTWTALGYFMARESVILALLEKPERDQ